MVGCTLARCIGAGFDEGIRVRGEDGGKLRGKQADDVVCVRKERMDTRAASHFRQD
jgi:hypothetical protein